MERQGNNRERIDTRISANDRLRLDELSLMADVSRSAIVRLAIRQLLDKAYTAEGYIRDEIADTIIRKGAK